MKFYRGGAGSQENRKALKIYSISFITKKNNKDISNLVQIKTTGILTK